MAAEHEAARHAAHARKLADKGCAAGRGALKREEEELRSGDEDLQGLQGWEDEP